MRKSKKAPLIKRLLMLALAAGLIGILSWWFWLAGSNRDTSKSNPAANDTPDSNSTRDAERPENNSDTSDSDTASPDPQPNQSDDSANIDDNSQEGEQKFDNPPTP